MSCDVCREMTFEEEAALFEKEASEIFAKENKTSEPSVENCVIRRGMRIIRKAREEKEQVDQTFEKFASEMKMENAALRKELEKYNIVKAVADMILR